jgi:hypothetical protein
MATGAVVNQGKTPFVEKYFSSNPDGNLESVNEAWTAAGNAGSLSESLVGKVRASLGLTGKRKFDASKPVEAPAKAKSETPAEPKEAKAKAPAKPEKVAKTGGQTPPASNGSHAPAVVIEATDHNHDEEVLDELEEGIDELIQKFRGMGGKPEVIKALKRARRLLVRSHEG